MKKAIVKTAIGGVIIGVISTGLVLLGNPANMGFCIACFLRDTAGAIGLHKSEAVQYVRPEIIGLVLGAFIIAVINREFSAKGGSSAFTRFILGALVMMSALVFLGCPMRMVLRVAGGDLNAIVGLVGFGGGIFGGTIVLNKGFSLSRTYRQNILEGAWFTALQIGLLLLLTFVPVVFLFSQKGPGSQHVPVWAALAAGIVVGVIAQRTRLCFVGGIRDVVLFKDYTLISGFGAILVTVMVVNLATGKFNLGFMGQPIAHIDGVWNLLSMAAVGFGCVLLGGCPLRQLILAGEGNSDSSITVMGLVFGAAISHNFKLASAATVLGDDGSITGGVTSGGKLIVVASTLIMLGIALFNLYKGRQKQ